MLNYQTFGGKIWRAASLVKCTFIILGMTLLFQQRSVIPYYCLRGKTNAQIVTKLEQGYHQDAERLRTVEKWGARFRAGRETVEDDERLGNPLRTILVMQFSDFLRRNLILSPARSVRPSTRHERQFSEFWTTLGFTSSSRGGYPITCPMRRRPIGSSFLNICSI
jgi:hypothetical protein